MCDNWYETVLQDNDLHLACKIQTPIIFLISLLRERYQIAGTWHLFPCWNYPHWEIDFERNDGYAQRLLTAEFTSRLVLGLLYRPVPNCSLEPYRHRHHK